MANRLSVEAAQKSKDARFHSLFDNAPIPIREEDLSGMKRMIDDLTMPDLAALTAYLDQHLEFLDALAKQIVVSNTKRAGIEQNGYAQKQDLLDNVVRTLSPASKRSSG